MEKHDHIRDESNLILAHFIRPEGVPPHEHYVTPSGGCVPLAMPGHGVHTHRMSGDQTTDTLVIIEPSEVFL